MLQCSAFPNLVVFLNQGITRKCFNHNIFYKAQFFQQQCQPKKTAAILLEMSSIVLFGYNSPVFDE